MKVYVNKKPIDLLDQHQIGEGGEARVFARDSLAYKIFHDGADPKVSKLRAQKLNNFPKGLPSAVQAPVDLIEDGRGEMIGYVMHQVPNALAVSELSNHRFRAQFTNEKVVAFFVQMQSVLSQLHATGSVIGDLNDGNVLLDAAGNPRIIDSDSMQFGRFPCVAAHEKFCDPRFYGKDFFASPIFDEASDGYALNVMLFSSLLFLHPYGGTHSTIKSLLRRAESKHSALRSDVTLPRLARNPKTLSDELLHHFDHIFEKQHLASWPNFLSKIQFTKCTCGLEHARPTCPDCHALGPLATRPVLRALGKCIARVVFQTEGHILASSMQGGLRYVYANGNGFFREDGTKIDAERAHSFHIQGQRTVVCETEGSISVFEAGKPVRKSSTDLMNGTAMIGVSLSGILVAQGDWLVNETSGSRIGQILQHRTWFQSGKALTFGFYRAGRATFAFIHRHDRAGMKAISSIQWHEKLIRCEAAFDDHHVIFSATLESNGHEFQRRWLLDESGNLLGQSDDMPAGSAVVLNGMVVIATDDGLMAYAADSQRLVLRAQFPDTREFVSSQVSLLADVDGSIFVIGIRDILQLTLHP
jgi:hypothetical protein